MYRVLGALTGVLLLAGLAFAADETKPHSAQAEKMTKCNAEARDKKLAGDERRHFMSECLKGHPDSGEAAPANKASSHKSSSGDGHNAQAEKMKTCNQEAATKKLHGDDRRLFMSECLKSDKKS